MHIFCCGGNCCLAAMWPWTSGRFLCGVSMFSSLLSLSVFVYVCVCIVIGCWPVPLVFPCLSQNAWWDRLKSPVNLKRISNVDIGWVDGWMDEYLLMHNYICYVNACQKVNNAFWSYGDQMSFHRDRLASHCSAFRLCGLTVRLHMHTFYSS